MADESATGDDRSTETSDERTARLFPSSRLFGSIARDVAIVLGALSSWAAADTWYEVTGLWLAQAVAVADGLVVGLLLAALFHEWGHYAGAVASGARAEASPPKGFALLRFDYDYAANDTRQFHWMSGGGHVAHLGLLILLVIALPLDTLSRIALVSAVFAFVVFASFVEFPVLRDTWSGADPETRLRAITARDFRQAMLVGSLSGLFAIAALS